MDPEALFRNSYFYFIDLCWSIPWSPGFVSKPGFLSDKWDKMCNKSRRQPAAVDLIKDKPIIKDIFTKHILCLKAVR